MTKIINQIVAIKWEGFSLWSLLCRIAKKDFLPEFSSCICNPSSVARMRAEKGEGMRKERERHKKRQRETWQYEAKKGSSNHHKETQWRVAPPSEIHLRLKTFGAEHFVWSQELISSYMLIILRGTQFFSFKIDMMWLYTLISFQNVKENEVLLIC